MSSSVVKPVIRTWKIEVSIRQSGMGPSDIIYTDS